MRLVTKAILASCLIIFSITSAAVTLILTSRPATQPLVQNPPAANTTYSSFETSMDNWTANGTDLTDPPITWWITPTSNQSYDGNRSLELYLNNLNDAGKIWIQRAIQALPNTQYYITVTYQLGTTDYGMNPFTIITGVTPQPPQNTTLTYQDTTDNGQDNGTLTWLTKSYDFVTTTTDTGLLYPAIGVWGTWETNRTYYLDDVTVTLLKIEPAATYPVIAGNWTATFYDVNGNATQVENATITQTRDHVKILLESGENISGILIPNVLAHPSEPADYIIWVSSAYSRGITIYITNADTLTASTSDGGILFTRP